MILLFGFASNKACYVKLLKHTYVLGCTNDRSDVVGFFFSSAAFQEDVPDFPTTE